MSQDVTMPVAENEHSSIDPAELESLGQEVIAAMRAMRELLAARATALDECRDALGAFHQRLQHENEQLSERESELCDQFEKRRAEVEDREKRCVGQQQRLDEIAESNGVQAEALREQQAAIEA